MVLEQIVMEAVSDIQSLKSTILNGNKRIKVDIYFTGVGMFERPTTQELQTLADLHEQNAG